VLTVTLRRGRSMRSTAWYRTPSVVVSDSSAVATAVSAWRCASACSVHAGRPFFMPMGVDHASSAPASNARDSA
jgi:hypothetical protein